MSFTKSRIFLVVCLIAILSFSFGLNPNKPEDLRKYYSRKIKVKAVVDQDPDVKDKAISFGARVSEINGQQKEAKIKVTMDRYPVYEYGTQLELEGKLEPKSEFSKKENISGELAFPKILSSETGQGNKLIRGLYVLKKTLLSAISSILPEPQSGLLAGILLGTRGMSKELQEDFRRTGTSHIVAVSGFNVTIIAGMLDKLFRPLGRKISFFSSVLAIFGFVIITGASASVVRAGFMGSLVLLAQFSGRIYASINSLVFAAAVMMLQNPNLLRFDIGFQLSFTALSGLLFVQPRLEELSGNAFLKNYIFPTLAAQITTTPIILYHFGNFSVIAILTNLLVLPLISITMLVGFLGVMTQLLMPTLHAVSGAVSWLLLTYIIKAIQICSRLPLASISEIPFPLWAVGVYYLILAGTLIWKPKQNI